MKINEIELVNFRSAAKTKLAFEPQLNLFVGVNGSGKSTVLDALSTCLSWLVKRVERESGRGTAITDTSVRTGQDSAALTVSVAHNNETYQWLLAKTVQGGSADVVSALASTNQLAQVLKNQYKQDTCWPVMAYYPVNRVVSSIYPTIPKAYLVNHMAVYDNALGGKTNYQSFFEWFRVQDDIANEQGKKDLEKEVEDLKAQLAMTDLMVGETSGVYNVNKIGDEGLELQSVTQAIEQFVPQYSNLRVKRTPQPHMLIDKKGVTFNLGQLSEGEKNLISLVGDIARRLAIGHSQSENPLAGEGIVLIDEIDLHLHPSWQRLVIPKLLEVFPNCQFFISTHSPQVISHVKPESVFLLSQSQAGLAVQKADETYGMSLDRVAELIMDDESRPSMVRNDLNKIFELIERNKLTEAKALICALKEDMKTDPDIMRAEMLVRREEMR